MARPFLLRTRWLVGHFVIVAVVALFLLAMNWQVDRLDERKARNEVTRSAMAATPLTQVPNEHEGPLPHEYQRLRLTGAFEDSDAILIRYPLHDGAPGYYLYQKFWAENDNKIGIYVNRGWIPLDVGKVLKRQSLQQNAASVEPPITIDVWWRNQVDGNAKVGVNFAGPDHLNTATKFTGLPSSQIIPGTTSGDLVVDGKPVTPIPLDGPDLGTGPHYGYAWQWFSFSLIGVIGWCALLWKAWREDA